MADNSSFKFRSNSTGRSGTTIHGFPAMLLGLPFCVIGIVILLVAGRVIDMSKTNKSPDLVLSSVGLIFFLAGLSFIVHGLRGVLAQRRKAQVRQINPGRPWLADYDWDAAGATDESLKSIGGLFIGLIFFSIFLIPFNWWAFVSDESHLFVKIVIGFFDLIPFAFLGGLIYQIGRHLKYGSSRLKYGSFPFFLGDEFRATLTPGRPIGKFKSVTIRLRCIQEEYVKDSRNKQSVICHEKHCGTIEIKQGGVQQHQVPITFKLPDDDALSTSMSVTPPRYWELEVLADTPGIDFGAKFLVPVYSRNRQDK